MGITLNRASSATVSFSTPQEIVITHLDDSIRIGDGTNLLTLNADGSLPTSYAILATQVDDASTTVTYVGEAETGTSSATAAWRIKKLTQTGSVLSITWADGNSNFDNVWNNRASLTYS